MAVLGVQMMMLKQQVAEQGMFPVLRQLRELGYDAVEVSQLPMDEANTAALEKGITELGLDVGALSVALERNAFATGDTLDTDFDKIVDDCRRLGTRYVRIGMMPYEAMSSKSACEAWAAACEAQAQRLGQEGITLLYHNHHVDLAQHEGERIFDLVRRVAGSVAFEVDLYWVQRGGMAPLDMLEEYSGVCKTIHLKDFRVLPLPPESMDLLASGEPEDRARFMTLFNTNVQFAEVGQGNMNWPALLPAARRAGADYFFVEQDDQYGRDPMDCLRDSREYLRSIGY